MTRSETSGATQNLLKQTALAHKVAYGDADPDWASWYANHIVSKLPSALSLSVTQLVCFFVEADQEHQARTPEQDWTETYSALLLERYLPEAEERLALYHFESCPFCRRVRAVVDKLGVDIELRDIMHEPKHRADLIAARGRATVPVLRCSAGELDRWMPESRDIIAYLTRRFE